MSKEKERKTVFEEAIRFETDGREFFLNAAEKAKTYFAKTIFQIIAEEELDHIKRIKQVYERYLTSGEQHLVPSMTKKGNLQNVFQQAKEKIDPQVIMNADEMEAIRLAIQLEIKGHEFYDRLAKEAENDFEKSFYQHLAQEEETHFSVLRQMEEAVMSPKSFG
jgi:rubrerythrin